jgi:hypothetical protein
VFWVGLYEGVIGLHFMRGTPKLLGTLKNCNSPLVLQGGSYEGRLWFFVRLVKQSLGELICVIFMFPYFVKLRDGVRNIGLCSLFGMKDLCYQM